MSDRRQRRLLLLEIALPVLLLAAGEAALRWTVHRHGILPRFFPFPITTGKYLAYEKLAGAPQPLDVLLMGMSPMLRVNAGRLAEQLSKGAQRPVQVFNFAAPMQTVAFNQRLLDQILLPLKQPRVIVFGVMPINLLHDESPEQTESFVRSASIFMAYDGSATGRVYRALLEHVYLIRYRELIRDWLFLPREAEPTEFLQMAQQTDAVGDIPFVAPDRPVTKLSEWEHNYKRSFVAFDAIMQQTLLFDHLAELARFCTAHGIRFVLLNNAVHPLFMQLFPKGRAHYDRYLFRLRATASDAQIPLYEPTADGIGAADLFQDTHHHNVRGSTWLTEQLATYLLDQGLLPAAVH